MEKEQEKKVMAELIALAKEIDNNELFRKFASAIHEATTGAVPTEAIAAAGNAFARQGDFDKDPDTIPGVELIAQGIVIGMRVATFHPEIQEEKLKEICKPIVEKTKELAELLGLVPKHPSPTNHWVN